MQFILDVKKTFKLTLTLILVSLFFIGQFILVSWNIKKQDLESSLYLGEGILGSWRLPNTALGPLKFNSDGTCHLNKMDYSFIKMSNNSYWVYQNNADLGFEAVYLSDKNLELKLTGNEIVRYNKKVD